MLTWWQSSPMSQSVLLVVATALTTWLIMRWAKSVPSPLNREQREIGSARDIGTQLDSARDRASLAEVERNRLALAKAVKAALWVTDARLNFAVPDLLKLAQVWMGQSKVRGKTWKPPEGVTQIEGLDDPRFNVFETHAPRRHILSGPGRWANFRCLSQ